MGLPKLYERPGIQALLRIVEIKRLPPDVFRSPASHGALTSTCAHRRGGGEQPIEQGPAPRICAQTLLAETPGFLRPPNCIGYYEHVEA